MVDTPAKSSETLTVGMLAQRLDGMDEAIRLVKDTVSSMPTPALVQADVNALRELTAAKFQSLTALMEAKFDGNKVALDAALKTQKEGSDKIESNFTKQTDNVVANIQTLTKSFDDKISDLKDRFNTREGRGAGFSAGWGYLVGGAGVVVAIITLVVLVLRQTATGA